MTRLFSQQGPAFLAFLLGAWGLSCDAPPSRGADPLVKSTVHVLGSPCEPDCAGHHCGPDGCGGSCGWCPDGEQCSDDGVCEWSVQREEEPACAGRECFLQCGFVEIPCILECMLDLGLTEDSEAMNALACSEGECPVCQLQGDANASGICKLMCFWEKCSSRHPECFGGEAGCWSVSTCLKGCKSQDSIELRGFESSIQCKTHCLMSGTVDAQWHYLALAECIYGECGADPGGACAKRILEGAVAEHEGACLPEVDGCEKH